MESATITATTVLATTSPEHAGASILAMLFCVALYFVPTIVAISRKAEKKAGIICLNVFAGWTGIGWIAALVWAFSSKTDKDVLND